MMFVILPSLFLAFVAGKDRMDCGWPINNMKKYVAKPRQFPPGTPAQTLTAARTNFAKIHQSMIEYCLCRGQDIEGGYSYDNCSSRMFLKVFIQDELNRRKDLAENPKN
jgi:hypothetical protein